MFEGLRKYLKHQYRSIIGTLGAIFLLKNRRNQRNLQFVRKYTHIYHYTLIGAFESYIISFRITTDFPNISLLFQRFTNHIFDYFLLLTWSQKHVFLCFISLIKQMISFRFYEPSFSIPRPFLPWKIGASSLIGNTSILNLQLEKSCMRWLTILLTSLSLPAGNHRSEQSQPSWQERPVLSTYR